MTHPTFVESCQPNPSSRRPIAAGLAIAVLLAFALPVHATGEQAQAETPSGNVGHVDRAVVTRGVVEREPIDAVERVQSDESLVYFYTDLRQLQGQNVLHRWKHGDRVMGEVAFHVGGPRWRVWSTKNLEPGWTGSWTIEVVDASGEVLATESFTYEPAAMAAATPAVDPMPTPAKAATAP